MGAEGAKAQFRRAAAECGFALCGVTRAEELSEMASYEAWTEAGMHAGMDYLTGRRGALRGDPRSLLPSARSVLCVGMLYRSGDEAGRPISRYAWGRVDYHDLLRERLKRMTGLLEKAWGPFEHKICVDTSPLLERSLARRAGLGWIGKNTCLINEESGSWYFLGEVLAAVDLEPEAPPADRCGGCTRCIDACPTRALVPAENGLGWALDSRRCISYWTIEHRGAIPETERGGMGGHVFGCDICQDVCPWNQRAPETREAGFARRPQRGLAEWARLTEEEFRAEFRRTPIWRAHHQGFLRNVALALAGSEDPDGNAALELLARCGDTVVEEHARWALARRR